MNRNQGWLGESENQFNKNLVDYLLRDTSTGIVYPLSPTKKTLIGRALDCQIVLNSPQDVSISRHHAQVRPLAESGGWEISDLNSNNGTYVNGQRLQGRQILQPGDRLTFGQSPTELIFAVQRIPTSDRKPKIPPSRLKNSPSSILSPSTWFPPRSKWRDVWREGRFSSVFIYLILCVLAIVVSDIRNIGSNASNVLFAACLLILALETLSQLCGKRQPWWLISVLAIITAVLTAIIYQVIDKYIPLQVILNSDIGGIPLQVILNPDIRKIPLKFILTIEAIKAPLIEAIKALPVLTIYFISRKLPSALPKRMGVYDPLDGILLTVASAIGLVLVESYFQDLRNIIAGILPNIAGDLAYSGVFGYYIGLSAIKSPRKRWKIIGFGYLFASILHLSLGILRTHLSAAGKPILSIIEYALLIANTLKGRDEAKQT